MNATNRSLNSFIASLKGKDFEDAILLAERESLSAYRKAIRPCRKDQPPVTDWCDYSRKLADMIYYLRGESNPLRVDPETRQLIISIKKGFSNRAA